MDAGLDYQKSGTQKLTSDLIGEGCNNLMSIWKGKPFDCEGARVMTKDVGGTSSRRKKYIITSVY